MIILIYLTSPMCAMVVGKGDIAWRWGVQNVIQSAQLRHGGFSIASVGDTTGDGADLPHLRKNMNEFQTRLTAQHKRPYWERKKKKDTKRIHQGQTPPALARTTAYCYT